MKSIFVFWIICMGANTARGQDNHTHAYRQQQVYMVNPEDTSQRIRTHLYQYDHCGNEIYAVTYRYDDLQPFDSQLVSAKDTAIQEFSRYSYRNACQPAELNIYDQDQALQKKITYSYVAGRLDQTEIYNGQGLLQTRTMYYYDEQGRKINEMRFNARNKNDQTINYWYRDSVLYQTATINHTFNDTVTVTYQYNDQKKLVRKEWHIAGNTPYEGNAYTYQDGRLISEKVQDYDGKTTEYRTTYYADGLIRTWQEIEHPSGTIRKYKYYEYVR